jgi:hypothetical protein
MAVYKYGKGRAIYVGLPERKKYWAKVVITKLLDGKQEYRA